MYLRKCRKTVSRVEYSYWQLVECHRTERGPRQRVVAYLSDMQEATRLGVAEAAGGRNGTYQDRLLSEGVAPEWVEVDVSRLRVERVLDFGAYWLGMELMVRLGLGEKLNKLLEVGREDIPWSVMAMVLVLVRLVDPSSELYVAEHLFERSALGDLLGIPTEKVNDDRLYRALDQVLPHKDALEKHLKERLGPSWKGSSWTTTSCCTILPRPTSRGHVRTTRQHSSAIRETGGRIASRYALVW